MLGKRGLLLAACVSRYVLGVVPLIGLVLAGRPAQAQDTLKVDLATTTNDTVRVDPGRYRILVDHRLPKAAYTITVAIQPVSIPPIPNPFAAPQDTTCSDLKSATNYLSGALREEDIPQAVEKLDSALRKAVSNQCDLAVTRARELRDSTSVVYPYIYRLAAGQYITVVVQRIPKGETTSRSWKKTFSTGSRGEWKISYGFIFPVVSGVAQHGIFGDEVQYFAKQASDTHFVITQQRSTRTFDAIPVVAFSFAPPLERSIRWNALTGGLGADITNPTAFIGTGLTYNSNLNVSAGLVFRKEPTLLGKYHVGDTVRANLSSDQLQEQVFRLRPFISLTFRFSNNPFNTSGSAGATGTQGKPETPPASPDTAGTKPKPHS